MVQLISIANEVDVDIREKFVIREKELKEKLSRLLELFQEAVILSTCNRTEVYFISDAEKNEAVELAFQGLAWKKELKKYISYLTGEEAELHLYQLACGFHSRILGEDQILGQIKDAYEEAMVVNNKKGTLQRLFQSAISCGKEFKTDSKLYEIPVSSASIAVNVCVERKVKNFMIIGYGEVGKLAAKYVLGSDFEKLYIIVRNPEAAEAIDDSRVKIISFAEKKEKLKEVEGIICCTSAPHYVLKKDEIPEEKSYTIFDLAIPRDVEETVKDLEKVTLFNIDKVSSIDDKNRRLREERMEDYRWIIDKYLEEFHQWRDTRSVVPMIKALKEKGNEIVLDRIEIYKNKTNKNKILDKFYMSEENKNYNNDKKDIWAEKMIKSTSDYYINRAIEALKEEKLLGSEEECIRIIEKIFLRKE